MSMFRGNHSQAVQSTRSQRSRLPVLLTALESWAIKKVLSILHSGIINQRTSIISSRQRCLAMQIRILLAHRADSSYPVLIDDLVVVPRLRLHFVIEEP